MDKRIKKLAIVFLCFVTALLCSFAVTACEKKVEPYYGTYYSGYREGGQPNKIEIGKTYKDSGGEYNYTYENGIMYVNNVKVVLAENYEVHYILEAKIWSYDAGKAGCSSINVRNGYLNDSLYIVNALLEMQERYNFMPDGTYEHYEFDDNMLPDIERGTYTLNSGVLTLNQTSYTAGLLTREEKTHRYWYISEDLNIYGGAYLKHPEKFAGMPNVPDTPDVPDIPTAQKFTLSYTADVGGRIIGSLTQTVESGKDGASVIAVADEGYEFIGWSDGVETAERQDTNVTKDISATAQFEIINTEFAGGAGTKERPYKISNIEQLKSIQKYPNSHFILNNDIVFDESITEPNFTPMFSDDNMFNGSLDGNGHKITNLTISNTSTFYTDLFACIGEKGAVKNLTLEKVNISGTNYIGGIAGYSLGAIENCSVSGIVNYLAENTSKVFIGGIVGRMENLIGGCSTEVTITCIEARGETNIGGVSGYLSGGTYDSRFNISECNTAGNIVCDKADSNVFIGGVFGYSSGYVRFAYLSSTGELTVTDSKDYGYAYCGGLIGCSGMYSGVTDSYTTGNVTATGINQVYCGGLVGGVVDTISNCYSTGDVTATGTSYVYCGGLVGVGEVTVSNSYTTGNVTATSTNEVECGGLVGSGKDTVSNSYTTGNVTATGTSSVKCGGLIGDSGSYDFDVTDSYTTGNITATGTSQVYCGGLIGCFSGYESDVTDSYTTGNITATGTSYVYCGGFAGYVRLDLVINSSYTVSKISVTCEGEIYMGAFVGYTKNFTLTNAHWLYYSDNGVEYAVGYGSSMGIPSSIGATKHTEVADFYTLAGTLNNGLEVPVWENLGGNALPTLKQKEEQN